MRPCSEHIDEIRAMYSQTSWKKQVAGARATWSKYFRLCCFCFTCTGGSSDLGRTAFAPVGARAHLPVTIVRFQLFHTLLEFPKAVHELEHLPAARALAHVS